MATATPIPEDSELTDLRSQLRSNLARVAKRSKENRGAPDSRLFRLQEKMTKMAAPANRFVQYVEEDDQKEAAVIPPTVRLNGKVNGAHLVGDDESTPSGGLRCPQTVPDAQDGPRGT